MSIRRLFEYCQSGDLCRVYESWWLFDPCQLSDLFGLFDSWRLSESRRSGDPKQSCKSCRLLDLDNCSIHDICSIHDNCSIHANCSIHVNHPIHVHCLILVHCSISVARVPHARSCVYRLMTVEEGMVAWTIVGDSCRQVSVPAGKTTKIWRSPELSTGEESWLSTEALMVFIACNSASLIYILYHVNSVNLFWIVSTPELKK